MKRTNEAEMLMSKKTAMIMNLIISCLHTLKKIYLGGIEIFPNFSVLFPPSQFHQRNRLKIDK